MIYDGANTCGYHPRENQSAKGKKKDRRTKCRTTRSAAGLAGMAHVKCLTFLVARGIVCPVS
jgi:hypothetical protein